MEPRKNCSSEVIPHELETALRALLKEGKTIEAIKRLRNATGAPLSACKAWIDDRWQQIVGITRKPVKPCPFCTRPLRTDQAQQCFECGMDWHDSGNVVRRG
jgi:hypothetical protein